jgi:hypothetical protein
VRSLFFSFEKTIRAKLSGGLLRKAFFQLSSQYPLCIEQFDDYLTTSGAQQQLEFEQESSDGNAQQQAPFRPRNELMTAAAQPTPA